MRPDNSIPEVTRTISRTTRIRDLYIKGYESNLLAHFTSNMMREDAMNGRFAGILIGLIAMLGYALLCGIEWGLQSQ